MKSNKNKALHLRRYFVIPALLLAFLIHCSLTASAAVETLSYTAEAVQGSGTVQNTAGGTIQYRIDWTQSTSHRQGPFNILVVSGAGQTKDYDLVYDNCIMPAPWYQGDCGSYMGTVAFIVVQEGITGLGEGFAIRKTPDNLQEVYLPLSLTKISANAFCGCRHLGKVVIPGKNVEIAPDAFQGSTVELTIYCNSGSTAEKYARDNSIPFKLMDQTSSAGSGSSVSSQNTQTTGSTSQNTNTQNSGSSGQTAQPAGGSPAACTHQFSAWKTTQKATVFKKGTKKRVCSLCGAKQTKSIAVLKPVLKLSKTKVSLKKGKKSGYITIKKMAGGDAVSSVKSSNAKIVKVVNRGKKRFRMKAGKIKGTAKITVRLKSGKTAKIKVYVK